MSQEKYSWPILHTYNIALLPLFATFDNIISRWLRKKLEDYKADKVYIPQLWSKLNNKNLTVKKKLSKSLDGLLQYQFISAFIKIFDSNSKYLNRNSILHGNSNYDGIGKKEC